MIWRSLRSDRQKVLIHFGPKGIPCTGSPWSGSHATPERSARLPVPGPQRAADPAGGVVTDMDETELLERDLTDLNDGIAELEEGQDTP